MLPFLQKLLRAHFASLPQDVGQPMVASRDSLAGFIRLADACPMRPTCTQSQALLDSLKRKDVLCAKAGISATPKSHSALHSAMKSRADGSPCAHATWYDGAPNKLLAQVGRVAHRSIWMVRVLLQFDEVLARKWRLTGQSLQI